MVKIEAVLHPEEAELVWAMLDHAASQLAREAAAAATATGGDARQDSAGSIGTGDAESPCDHRDSAESPTASAPCCTVAGAPGGSRDSIGGSARVADDASPPAKLDSAEPATASAPCCAGAPGGSRDSTGSARATDDASPHAECDSAESPPASAPCCTAASAPGGSRVADDASPPAELDSAASPAVIEPCGSAASALGRSRDSSRSAWAAGGESPHAEHVSGELPTVSAPCGSAASAPARALIGDRAEWPNSLAVACSVEGWSEWTGSTIAGCLAGERTGSAGPTQAGEGAARSEVAGRSLLDRLLDEAEACRRAEPTVDDAADPACASGQLCDSPTLAPDLHEAEPRGQQPVQRAASVLRDRAAAAREAFNRADALVEIAQGYLRGDRPDRSPIEVTLTVPVSVLRDEPADPVEVGALGESFLSRNAARRLSCDAAVVEIVEDDEGTPLSVGRKQRTITGSLRRALHRRDGSCTYPGCTNQLFLEGHHIQHWADGGETSLSNTALLCSLHHRHVHELGYTIELGPDQRPRFRDPRGRPVAAVPQAPALGDLGWPRIRAANEPLAIDASTIAGPWDGTPVDYARIVGHLATADGLA
jgi:hypothetical protein